MAHGVCVDHFYTQCAPPLIEKLPSYVPTTSSEVRPSYVPTT